MAVATKKKRKTTVVPGLGLGAPELATGRAPGVQPLAVAPNYQAMPKFRSTLFTGAEPPGATMPRAGYGGAYDPTLGAPFGAPGSAAGGGKAYAPTTYYTYKAEVPMQGWDRSAVIGYTPGKGYYKKYLAPGGGGAAAPAAGPPGEINIPGFNPDYGAAIEGDWEYRSALADLAAADKADQAALNQGLKSLAVGYGGDLSSLVKQGLIDQQAADAAKSNEFSFSKELDRALGRGQAGAAEELGSRGSLRSGALAVMQGMLQENYQREQTKGMNDLLAQIGGLRTGAAQASAGRRSGLANVRASIANRLAADPRYAPRAGGAAKWNADVGGYVTSDGRIYDRNGNLLY
jgi:hypothetical protein